MRIIALISVFLFGICIGTAQDYHQNKEAVVILDGKEYKVFGDRDAIYNLSKKNAIVKKITNLKEGDSLSVTFKTPINEVCSVKGCWMNVVPYGEKEVMVRFKDYGFFVPLDSAGKDAIVNGKMFAEKISVAQLKHYAEDGGKTKEEIEAITQPELKLSMIAESVLIEN